MATSLPPPGYEEIHRSEFARIFGRVVGARLHVAPVVALLAVGLVCLEPAPWRRAALLVVAGAGIAISLFEARRYRRQGMAPRAADLNLAAGALGQLIVTAVTGGLESPFLPLMLILSMFLGMIMVERPWHYWALIGAQVASLWAFAAVAVSGAVAHFNLQAFGGGARAGHSDLHLWTLAVVMTLAVLAATNVGHGMRRIFDSMLRRALDANEALRREHAERSREVMAVSGEIAHELKNPLSSVKGLAALLSQDASEAKLGERLSVLRREIDRMQLVLDEFLNFSRPLVPLSLETADLAALCDEVAALHEGLAHERGVAIELRASATPVKCDPRKVKQILVNLVQNALEASGAGQTVALECGAAERASVRVLDRGKGLDPDVVPRLFEPGATTKPKGSGLGLTIARSLARQHGGDLTLSARDGGGCVAELCSPGSRGSPSRPRREPAHEAPGALGRRRRGRALHAARDPQSAGLEVEEAADGADALARLEESAFQLVITDLRMPRIDGLELLKRARNRPQPPRVILITAHGSEKHAVEAMKAGAFGSTSRPSTLNEPMARGAYMTCAIPLP